MSASHGTAAKPPKIKPFWSRVTLIESPVDSEQLDSGLIVPTKYEGDGGVQRGVVLDVDAAWEGGEVASDQIGPGTVVYYRGGVRLPGNVVVVELSDILAYEG